MTYWLLNLPFLAVVAVVALAALLARRAPRWRVVGLAAIVLLLLTVVFDNVLVATGIVGYDPTRISGLLVGVAPLEDFAYAAAAVVLLPSLWALLGGGER
ncbi:MAG: lycopene cyclase domain-containing protein [Pseudolysinimonas sp.]